MTSALSPSLRQIHQQLIFPAGRDPRPLVGASALGGVLVWLLPWPWAAVPCLAGLLAPLGVRERLARTPLRLAVGFVGFWMLCKFGLDTLFGAATPADSLLETALLGLRLAATMGLGLALAAAATPLGLGLTCAWLLGPLRPLLGEATWKPALALMVMMALLPRCAAVLRDTWSTVTRRCPHLALRARLALFGAAAVQRLDRETQVRAWALVLRNLTCERAWRWPAR